jgi:ribose transport system permease protein
MNEASGKVLEPAELGQSSMTWGRFGGQLRTAGILLPFLAIFIALSIWSSTFLHKANLLNILDQQAWCLVTAAAGTLVLIAGGIDLSIGSIYLLAQDVAAQLALHTSPAVAIILAILLGATVGLVNGVVVAYLRINALIATLAMSFIVIGIANVDTNGTPVSLFNKPSIGRFANTQFLGVATAIWVTLLVVVILGLILWRTTFGRHVYAAGGNAEAARLAGVRVSYVRIITFVLSGAAAALGGTIDLSRTLTTTTPDQASGLAFTVLAGIVVGGTSIAGGDGAVSRTVLGVLFIALIQNGFLLLGFNPLLIPLILGVILIIAVGLDVWTRQRRR